MSVHEWDGDEMNYAKGKLLSVKDLSRVSRRKEELIPTGNHRKLDAFSAKQSKSGLSPSLHLWEGLVVYPADYRVLQTADTS